MDNRHVFIFHSLLPFRCSPIWRRNAQGKVLPMQLKDVAVLITGGGSGLGAATARALAAKGAKIAVLDQSKENAEKIAAEVKGVVYPLAKFARISNVNLIGTFNCLRLFAERLVTAEPIGEERGVIINTASVAAYEGQIGQIGRASCRERV